jgi:hypothetical protein
MRRSKSVDPSRLAAFMDQDWARASFAGTRQVLSPYASLDLNRPVSGFSAASLASLGASGVNVSSTAALEQSLFSENNDRDLLRNNDTLSTMKSVVKSSPDLPVVSADIIKSVPATLEQEGVAQATFHLNKSQSEGDFSKDLQFRDSKFMFGFVSRQMAVLENAPPKLESLGRLSTCEERRIELKYNQSKKAAENLVKLAKGQKDRRTMLMEIRHPYLLEGSSAGVFNPSDEFKEKLQRRRQRAARKSKVQQARHRNLALHTNSLARRGFNPFADSTLGNQLPVSKSEQKLFMTKSRRATPIHNSEERLFVREEKPRNLDRTDYLWNRDTGGKQHNIINSTYHDIQPTGPQADMTRPRDRRMRHPSLIVHGLPHVVR